MVQNNKKRKAVELRLQGKSYGEILRALNISSKGTLSAWFRNLKLPDKAKRLLAAKIDLAKERGLFAFNKKRTKIIKLENKNTFADALNEIKSISKKELLLIGTALYWSEGTTRENNRYPILSFSNSDPQMIKVFMRYLKDILIVPQKKLRIAIHIHPNINENKAKKFWSEITKMPENEFYIYRQISSASKLKRPKNFLPFGTLNIRVINRRLFYCIKGHIQGIINQI